MPKFDSSAFSDVEYDLSGFKSTKKNDTYEIGQSINDKGTVPEPSRHLVAQTMKAVSAAFKEMNVEGADKLGDNPSPEEVSATLEKLDAEDEDTFENMTDTLVEIVGDFCQGKPSLDSLDALSWPKFMGFFGYLMEHMLSPEASVPGTKDTRILKSV